MVATACVVKAQILAGGRGKGGGIQFATTPAEAQAHASGMLGAQLVTRQTNQKGIEIKFALIEEAVSIKKELYLAITIDRSLQTPMLIASAEGGVEIEEVAKNHLIKLSRNPLTYFLEFISFRRVELLLN